MNKSFDKLALNVAEQTHIGKEAMQDFLDTKVDNGTHTGAVGAGKEAMKSVTYKDELYSMIVDESDLLSRLPGNHGQIDGLSAQVTIKGLPQLMAKGLESKNPSAHGDARNDINTDKIILEPKKFTDSFYISYEAIKGFVSAEGLYNYILKLAKDNMRLTAQAFIINADGVTDTAAGNVNHKDAGTPVALDTSAYYLNGGAGIVKTAIDNGVVSPSTPVALSTTLLKKLRHGVGQYAAEVKDLIFLASGQAYTELTFLDTYTTIDKFGQKATNNTGLLERVNGIELFSSQHFMPAVAADGFKQVGSTAANPHVGLSLFYAPAVQYGFGHDSVLVPTVDEHGIRVGYSMWFDAKVINKKAGLGKTVAGAVIAID